MEKPQNSVSERPTDTALRPPRTFWLILLIGISARLVHWWTVHDLPFFSQLIMDSQEYDRWATEIFEGNWLGTEVFFQAPLYPYLVAALYSLFGHSYDIVYLFQIAFYAVGAYGLYRTGAQIADRRVGLAAAALLSGLAILPFYDVQILKESAAVSVVCLLLWALTTASTSSSPSPWLLSGLAAGILILLRENMLLVLPLLALPAFAAVQGEQRPPLATGFKRSGLLLIGVVLTLSPVALRNGWVGGNYLPTTFQGGTNFYIGNNPEADGTYKPIVAGKQIPVYERQEPIRLAEAALGHALTPAEVSSYWLGRSLVWALEEPGDFLGLQFRKLGMFWRWYEWPDAVDYYFVRKASPVLIAMPFELGSLILLACVGLWQVRDRLFSSYLPIILFVLGWTGSTVIFFIFSRYRLPIAPALALLAAVPVAAAYTAFEQGRRKEAGLGVLLLVAAIFLPRLAMPEPRMDLVHYNLGVIYHQNRQAEPAEAHFRETLRLNPEHFLAAMNLGRLAATRRDWPEALSWFEQAERLEPTSDDVKLNLGAVYMAQKQFAHAKTHLEQAMAINDRNPGILHNLAITEVELWRQGQGDLERARALNQRTLELQSDHARALALRDRIERLQQTEAGEPIPAHPP